MKFSEEAIGLIAPRLLGAVGTLLCPASNETGTDALQNFL